MEGVDFSGKTTVAGVVVDELRAHGVATRYNSARLRMLRNWAKRLESAGAALRVPSDALFLAAVLYDTARVAGWLRRGVSVVQDRYYASYVCHQAASVRARPTRRPRLMLRVYRRLGRLFLVPDAVIFCRSDPRALVGRFEAARSSSPSSLSANDVSVYSADRLPDLDRHQRCFEALLVAARATIVIDNVGALEELRGEASRAAASVLT